MTDLPPSSRPANPASPGQAGAEPAGTARPAPIPRPRRPSGLLRLLLSSWPFWIVVAAALAATILFVPFGGSPILSLVSSRDSAVSDLVLDEVKDIYRFSSVEYLYRVVFPYDFVSPGVSAQGILRKVGANLGVAPEKLLTPEEKDFFDAQVLARKYGLNILAPDYHFLVATVILRAGFDMEQADMRDWVSIGQGPDGSKTARLTLPPAAILDVRVEDPDRANYPYPDVPISPEGWKELSRLLQEHARRLAIADGILEKAGSNASSFLSRLLLNSGFSQVTFNQPPTPANTANPLYSPDVLR